MELRERLENLDEDTLLDIAEAAIRRRRAVIAHTSNIDSVNRGAAGPGALDQTAFELAEIEKKYSTALDAVEQQFRDEDEASQPTPAVVDAEPVQTSAPMPEQGSPEDLDQRAAKILGNS
jgi:hypothetical protein